MFYSICTIHIISFQVRYQYNNHWSVSTVLSLALTCSKLIGWQGSPKYLYADHWILSNFYNFTTEIPWSLHISACFIFCCLSARDCGCTHPLTHSCLCVQWASVCVVYTRGFQSWSFVPPAQHISIFPALKVYEASTLDQVNTSDLHVGRSRERWKMCSGGVRRIGNHWCTPKELYRPECLTPTVKESSGPVPKCTFFIPCHSVN